MKLIIIFNLLITESEDLSSGDISEPCTPHTQLSPKSSLAYQQEEINRKYYELQHQISLEFQAKQKEWERIRTTSVAVNSQGMFYLFKIKLLILLIGSNHSSLSPKRRQR